LIVPLLIRIFNDSSVHPFNLAPISLRLRGDIGGSLLLLFLAERGLRQWCLSFIGREVDRIK
jgi:hypothetical protein